MCVNKNAFFLFLFFIVGVGLSAQTSSGGAAEFSFRGLSSPGFNLCLVQKQFVNLGDDSSHDLDDGAGKASALNILFGLWSWSHNDVVGGLFTTLLEGGGIFFFIIGITLPSRAKDSGSSSSEQLSLALVSIGPAIILGMVGVAAFVGGIIFGTIRGAREYRRQNATAGAENPLNHISVAVLPTNDGGICGNISYTLKF